MLQQRLVVLRNVRRQFLVKKPYASSQVIALGLGCALRSGKSCACEVCCAEVLLQEWLEPGLI